MAGCGSRVQHRCSVYANSPHTSLTTPKPHRCSVARSRPMRSGVQPERRDGGELCGERGEWDPPDRDGQPCV
ncbi:hypothetical protein BDV93DRAFT_38104 [Ceratobasidium sp. AG-I]|nr:hypothetical protein BDV93DRAFT_38104 [Ceratobasidium sp. AG-I]